MNKDIFSLKCDSLKDVEDTYYTFLQLILPDVYSINEYPIVTKTVYENNNTFILQLDVR
jgi:hypothetical protein